MMDMNETFKSQLLDLIRSASLSRLKSLSQMDNLKFGEIDEEPRVFSHWMSFAFLSGKNLRIVFKAHFMTSAAQFFASKIYKGPKEKIKSTQAIDFFKEFCGLTVGQLKLDLSKSNVRVGISLPGLIRGFDEVFYKRTKGVIHDFWRIEEGSWRVDCSVDVEVFEKFSIVDLDSVDQTKLGDVEFL